jgi:hypothetical protein
MFTNITKTWTITISEDEVFSRCTNESLYQAYNRSSDNPKGDAVVIQEDDKGQFSLYFSNAIANLRMLLARRMDDSGLDDMTTFKLLMHHNHDDNILPILISHCYDYVTKKVLEQWYGADLGSEAAKLEINHCLHYRRHPVRRMIGPLF